MKQHIMTDCESNRTFLLCVAGRRLVELKELKGEREGYVSVPTDTRDGEEWWEQWSGEVECGEFDHADDDGIAILPRPITTYFNI